MTRCFDLRIDETFWAFFLSGVFLLLTLTRALPAQEAAPVKIALTTSDRSSSVRHQVVDGIYQIEISHMQSLIGKPRVELTVQADELGIWSESSVVHGDNVLVDLKGRTEPRNCSARLAKVWSADPATDYATEVMQRVEDDNGKVSETAAKREIDRLINQYGLTNKHVLKLPRSAANRSEPAKTLARLCRWVTYDQLFLRMKMDPRPVATESDAEEIYQQVMSILNGEPPGESQNEQLLSDEEKARLKEAFEFTYTTAFTPHLVEGQADQRWRHAARVKVGPPATAPVAGIKPVGTVVWSGEVGELTQRSVWLAVPDSMEPSAVSIGSDRLGKEIRWVFVEGPGEWNFLRVFRAKASEVGTFQIRIAGDSTGTPIELIQRRSPVLEFPF